MANGVQIAIVGSGPSGLSCAAHAAELGIPHVLLEAEDHPCHTVFRYQKGKHVMAEPAALPLRSALAFAAGKREPILAKWAEQIAQYRIDVRYRSRVSSITGAKGAFEIKTAAGDLHRAAHVVLSIGLQGNPRTLGVPGDDLPLVQYQLDDPGEYSGETIVVVGAGDAAIENALALAEENRVIMINRADEFARAKEANLALVLSAIREGRIECRYGTKAVKIEVDATGDKPGRFVARTNTGEEWIPCHRVIARLGAIPPRALVESFGVRFPSPGPESIPQVSSTYESNVPGLYIIGALGGYPLIKQAMNQGFEVVEYILGNVVEPADEPLLKRKFGDFKRGTGVSEVLEEIRRNVPLFADLTTLQLREFMIDSEIRTLRTGQLVFRKGDYADSFFSIVEGDVIVQADANDDRLDDVVLRQGDFFGEVGLLSGRRRTASVKAGERCVLIETPRRSVLKLIANQRSARQLIDQAFLRRVMRSLFAPALAPSDMDEMVAGAQVRQFAADEDLFKEGDEPDGLHVIRRGSVSIIRQIGGRDVVLSYVAAGNYVGEMALVSSERRNATVRASVNTETIVLPADILKKALARSPDLRARLSEVALERLSKRGDRENQPDSGSLVSFLLEQGLGEATDVLLIDESLCIRCDNCEKACADSHDGTSRLDREAGPTYANIHVPTSCRHCENPHCMKDCPPDAIHRNRAGEVFIDDTCIGCGNCERNCPYGVIQLAPVKARPFRPSLLSWLLTGFTTEPGRERKVAANGQAVKAVKCDMCSDLSGGPACVRACPTGAAIRVRPEQFIEYLGN